MLPSDAARKGNPAEKRSWPAVYRLLRLARTERARLTVGTLALLVVSGLNLACPKLLELLIDGAQQAAGNEKLVNDTVLLLLAVVTVVAGLSALRRYMFWVAGEHVIALLRQQLYKAILRQDIAFFDVRKTGELINRLASDTTAVKDAATEDLSALLRCITLGVGATAVLFWTSWKLALVVVAVTPGLLLGVRFYGRRLRSASRQVHDAFADSTDVAQEAIAGIRTVRAFAREAHEEARYAERVTRVFDLARKNASLHAVFTGLFTLGGYAAIVLVLWYGGRLLVR
ncbi:MAG: ABC transporter transmembrane domain-containing protein, partial [Planctomycetota bacterium]